MDKKDIERFFAPKTEEEKRMEREKYKREVLEKGFLPVNDGYNETMHTSMEYVEANPREFIIEECVPACCELWNKNIYTFMVSDHLNEGVCWIEVISKNLSDENKEIFNSLEGEDVVKFSYHKGCVNFGINTVGERGQKRLLELAQNFKMQDVPYGEAYITINEFLFNCGCYKEIKNPDYVEMENPLGLDLPPKEMLKRSREYHDWLSSSRSSETIKVFDQSKVTKPLEEYFEGREEILDGDRVYLSNYHYQKHMNYVNSLVKDNDTKKK